MSRSFLVILALLLMSAASPIVLAQTEKPATVKLHAVYSDTLNIPQLDTQYHYLAGQAEKAYADGDLPKAEKLYAEALANAQKSKVPPKLVAMLHTNLAAVLRDEHSYTDSEKHFKAAIEMERTNLHSELALMEYTAKHYAVLLAKTGREFEARFIEESAKNAFVVSSSKDAAISNTTFDTGISTDTTIMPPEKKKTSQSASNDEPIMVNYTITLTPMRQFWDAQNGMAEALAKNAAKCQSNCLRHRVSQPLTFHIYSQYRPISFECQIPPDTWLVPKSLSYDEVLSSPKWYQPIIIHTIIGAPCNFEKTTVSGTCLFRSIPSVLDSYGWDLPSDTPLKNVAGSGEGQAGSGGENCGPIIRPD